MTDHDKLREIPESAIRRSVRAFRDALRVGAKPEELSHSFAWQGERLDGVTLEDLEAELVRRDEEAETAFAESAPALTPEEWDRAVHVGGGVLLDNGSLNVADAPEEGWGPMELHCDSHHKLHAEDRHRLAALALHGQRFGFTREQLEVLRAVAGAFARVSYGEAGGPIGVIGPAGRVNLAGYTPAVLREIAERIDRLLPPADAATDDPPN